MSKLAFQSPKGEIKWAFISGHGRKNDLNGRHEYSIDIVVPQAEARGAIEALDTFWEENKPKDAKQAKSMGYRIDEESGNVTFTFKTTTTYPSGDPKVIRIFNAKAQEMTLPEGQKIGNGSRGRAAGTAAIYDGGKAARGVTLYLDAVQLTKFVAYQGSTGFEADLEDAEDDEDTFTGFDAE